MDRKIEISMEWNEMQQKWLMKLRNSKIMLQEFFDCTNVRRYFKGLDKTIPQSYQLIIKKLIVILILLIPLYAYADTLPPVGSIGINKDTKVTTTRWITLKIEANDENGIKRMCISNTDTCPGWQAYERNIVWVLPIGNGIKTVHLWVEDMVGNVSHTVDSILLQE